MAEVPNNRLTQAGFLNHIRRVLDSDLQRWEFAEPSGGLQEPPYIVAIRQGISGGWFAIGHDQFLADRLTGLLNGFVRAADGQMVRP